MESLYQTGAVKVPQDFAKPTKSFKKHLVLAVLGLFAFVAIYTILTIWFATLSVHLFQRLEGNEDNWLLTLISAICMGVLSLFMIKSLFIWKKDKAVPGIEVKKQDEPLLFDFLFKLADEAGAPRPNKVYISHRVNASVFYDLNIFNLIFPTKKNLEIGLGLVNVLNLGESKAVLAHEFGHFAQKSMLLGRYVYVAQQIAVRVVQKRDALDAFLAGISTIDIRIAWVGWILSILVWAVRALVETIFGVVVIAERALSREMEFQADLVAVSLTGSDALIHALYKLGVADQALQASIGTLDKKLGDKKAVPDLYDLQSNYIAKMRWVLNDQRFGESPEVGSTDGSHRVFDHGFVNPPQMWSTHPADHDREENAKKVYIAAEIDNQTSWKLFEDEGDLRTKVTADLINTAKIKTELISREEALEFQNHDTFDWAFLDPKYKGAYLGRLPFIYYQNPEDVYDTDLGTEDRKELFKKIYPESLKEILKQIGDIEKEEASLKIVQHEVATAEKRVIRHRGKTIKRADIPDILNDLKQEKEKLRAEEIAHDKLCRKLHLEVAEKQSHILTKGLQRMIELIHYAEHSIHNLQDAWGKYHNMLQVVLADGKVSSSEMVQVISVSADLHKCIKMVYDHQTIINPGTSLLKKMKVESYNELLEEFKLPYPNQENISNWSNVVESWVNGALAALDKLRNAVLEKLLELEEVAKNGFLSGGPIDVDIVDTIELAEKYHRLTPGKERPLQYKLSFWDRFHMSDGLVASSAKFLVSAIVIFGAIFISDITQESAFYIYNGLDRSVDVSFDNSDYRVDPHSYTKVSFDYGSDYKIETRTTDGEFIESLDADLSSHSRNWKYIYNVANSGVFMRHTVSYGYDAGRAPKNIGAARFFASKADYVLEEPPEEDEMHAVKSFLVGYSGFNASGMLAIVEDENEQKRLAATHALWDNKSGEETMNWLEVALQLDSAGNIDIIKKRIKRDPNDVASIRMLHEYASPADKAASCKQVNDRFEKDPSNADLYYLKTRCMDDEEAKNIAFLEGHKKWPEHSWLSFASGYVLAEREQWEEALKVYKTVLDGDNVALASQVSLDVNRVARFLYAKEEKNDYRINLSAYPTADYYSSLELGKVEGIENDVNRAYFLMAWGRFERAISHIEKYPDQAPFFYRMLAASEGAPDNIIDKVNNYKPEEGVNFNTAWSAMALAGKSGRSLKPYLDYLKGAGMSDDQLEKVTSFIKEVKAGNLESAQDIKLSIPGFNIKAHLCVMARIILGSKTPDDWKLAGSTMLYVTERPYFMKE